MAGDIKRQRKSWTLQGTGGDRTCCFFFCPQCLDRSKVSINILRANLAEEGDEDAQLDVAKRLLQESSSTGDPGRNSRHENARLALYWLIKSSEQGNNEATELLQECLQSGNGLTAQNILDVQTCITTPKYEKLTFKAARTLYRKLSNGEEFITTAQLLALIKAREKRVLPDEGYKNGSVVQEEEEVVSEGESTEHFVEEEQHVRTEKKENSSNAPLSQEKCADLNETFTLPSQSVGRPLASSTPPKHKPNSLSFHSQPQMGLDDMQASQLDLQFAMKKPGKKLTLSDLFNVAKDFNAGKAPKVSVDEQNKLLLRHHWNLDSSFNIFVLQILILAVLGKMIHIASGIVYTLYLGILWSCYNCFLLKLRSRNFKDWQLAFKSVLMEDWKTNKLEMRFSIKNILPYIIIPFSGLLFLHLLADDKSKILCLSAGVTVILSIQLGLRQTIFPSWRHIIVLATAFIYYQPPFILNLVGENLIQQESFLYESLLQVRAFDQLRCLPFSIDLFFLLITFILGTTVKLSINDFLNSTIPDIVLMLWIVKLIHTSVIAEGHNLFIGFCIGFALSVVMILLCSHYDSWKVCLVLLVGITIVGSLQGFLRIDNGRQESSEARFLEWEDYEASCHRKAWNVQSPAATQIKCSIMFGDGSILVKWRGRISVVKVENLSRSKDSKSLENAVFDISVGIFPSHKDDETKNWQNFLTGSSDTGINAPASLIVKTSDVQDKKHKQDLIDHILNFRTGDKIEFVGKLKGSTAGSLKPQIVDIQSIQCLSCTTADYGEFEIKQENSNFRILNWLIETILEFPNEAKSSNFLEKSKTYAANGISYVYKLLYGNHV